MSRTRACCAALATAALLLPALPAYAASGITAPGAGQVVAEHQVVPLRAVVEGPAPAPSELSLLAPGAESAEVVAVSTDPDGGELSHDFDTACATTVCTGRAPAANGTWTLRLSGAAQDERTFVLRIPPAAPDDVTAAPSEDGVLLRWQQGDEPDLRAYRVEDAAGDVVRDGLAAAEVCDADRTCQAEVPAQAGAWTVRAYRATCPDCTDLLLSSTSAVVRAEGEAGPLAAVGLEPSPTPQQAAPPARKRPNQRSAFLAAFGSGRPAAGAVPAPAGATPQTAPQADGTFGEELGYGEREVVLTEPRAPLSRAQDAIGSALGSGDRVRLLVLSALMVGGSLWLRRWARRAIAE